MSVLRLVKMAQEINYIVVRYMSWIAQLDRALAWKAKGLGSSPGPGQNFSLSILDLVNRWPSSENYIFNEQGLLDELVQPAAKILRQSTVVCRTLTFIGKV